MKSTRKTWENYFFSILEQVQNRATCDRGKCGCLIVSSSNIILSTGYVGSLPGFPHCDEAGHDLKSVTHQDGQVTQHCNRTIHAEQNAICQAARQGIRLEGSTAYTTLCPCRVCAQMLVSVGIQKVLFQYYYSNFDGMLQLIKSNVQCFDYLKEKDLLTDITYLYNSTYPNNEDLFFRENIEYFKSRQTKY